jgi:hypothetical protein
VGPTFSHEEADLLLDILDNWEEGCKEAKKETTTDRTVESVEELVDLSTGYDDQLALVKSIREKVKHDNISIPTST